MTVKLSSILVDVRAEREGEWQEVAEWPGVAFKVKSTENPAFKDALSDVRAKLAKRYDDKIPSDELTKYNGELYADHLLVDWRGLDVPYSHDEATDILTDPKGRRFTFNVLACALKVGERDLEFVKEAEKNSEVPSATA